MEKPSSKFHVKGVADKKELRIGSVLDGNELVDQLKHRGRLSKFDTPPQADRPHRILHSFALQLRLEWNLFATQRYWTVLVFALIILYVHNVVHNVAYFVYEPEKALVDIGFLLFPFASEDVWFKMGDALVWVVLVIGLLFLSLPMWRADKSGFSQLQDRHVGFARCGFIGDQGEVGGEQDHQREMEEAKQVSAEEEKNEPGRDSKSVDFESNSESDVAIAVEMSYRSMHEAITSPLPASSVIPVGMAASASASTPNEMNMNAVGLIAAQTAVLHADIQAASKFASSSSTAYHEDILPSPAATLPYSNHGLNATTSSSSCSSLSPSSGSALLKNPLFSATTSIRLGDFVSSPPTPQKTSIHGHPQEAEQADHIQIHIDKSEEHREQIADFIAGQQEADDLADAPEGFLNFPLFSRFTFFSFSRPCEPHFAVLMIARVLMVLSIAQILRMVSFTSTRLPGPAAHCQPGSDVYNPPTTALEIAFRFDTATSCGDLIFSSHASFCIVASLAVMHYYRNLLVTGILFALSTAMSLLLVATHRHYSVDLVIAWYVVPLVWLSLLYVWPDPSELELCAMLEPVVQQRQLSYFEKHRKQAEVRAANAQERQLQVVEIDESQQEVVAEIQKPQFQKQPVSQESPSYSSEPAEESMHQPNGEHIFSPSMDSMQQQRPGSPQFFSSDSPVLPNRIDSPPAQTSSSHPNPSS